MGEGSRVEHSGRERKVLSRQKLQCYADPFSEYVFRPARALEDVFQTVHHCCYVDLHEGDFLGEVL